MAGASLCLAPAQADVRPGSECPSGEACVIVHLEGDRTGTYVVDAATIDAEQDQIGKTYQVRGPGDEPTSENASGLSINKIIGLIGVTPDSVTFSQAVRSDGLRSELVEGDFGPSGEAPFQDGLVPIVRIEGRDDAIGYIRPLRDDADSNRSDFFQTDSRSALHLYIHTDGKPLHPVLTATPADQPTANEPVRLDASEVTGPDLTYDWTFGDGQQTQTTTPTTTHQYAPTTSSGQDTFEAYVEVNGSDSSSGRSNQVRIAIGSPPPSTSPTPGSGTTKKPDAPATGPDTSEGDTSGAAPSTSGGTGGTGGTGSGGTPGLPSAPDAAPVPSEVLTADPGRVVNDGLVPVSGILLGHVDASGEVVPAASSSARDLALSAAAARRGSTSRPAPWGVVAGVLGLAALVGAGAASESTWVRRRLSAAAARISR